MSDKANTAIETIRRHKGLSQQNIADEIGITRTTYSKYELGKIRIKHDHMVKLAAFYKMSIDELIHYGDPEYSNVSETKIAYTKRLIVPITVSLDGTEETLNTWIKTLTAINASVN